MSLEDTIEKAYRKVFGCEETLGNVRDDEEFQNFKFGEGKEKKTLSLRFRVTCNPLIVQ